MSNLSFHPTMLTYEDRRCLSANCFNPGNRSPVAGFVPSIAARDSRTISASRPRRLSSSNIFIARPVSLIVLIVSRRSDNSSIFLFSRPAKKDNRRFSRYVSNPTTFSSAFSRLLLINSCASACVSLVISRALSSKF